MVRISKQSEKRARSPRRNKKPAIKTGPREESIGFREHKNALEGEIAKKAFIPKIK